MSRSDDPHGYPASVHAFFAGCPTTKQRSSDLKLTVVRVHRRPLEIRRKVEHKTPIKPLLGNRRQTKSHEACQRAFGLQHVRGIILSLTSRAASCVKQARVGSSVRRRCKIAVFKERIQGCLAGAAGVARFFPPLAFARHHTNRRDIRSQRRQLVKLRVMTVKPWRERGRRR